MGFQNFYPDYAHYSEQLTPTGYAYGLNSRHSSKLLVILPAFI